MRIFFLFITISVYSLKALAGGDNPAYSVAAIPAELFKNANVVKRMEELKFTIYHVNDASIYHKYAYTILNEKGDGAAQLVEWYDKLRNIDYIDAVLYDASGNKIKSLKKSDISDLSGTSEGNLADDNRIKKHNFYYRTYPYTVEYEVKIDLKYTMFFPLWVPVSQQLMSVENSSFKIICPTNYEVRFKAYNYKEEPVMETNGGDKIYNWNVNKITALQDEYASPDWLEVTPTVVAAPVEFAVEDNKGNMKTWKDFGKFISELKNGRDVLPDNIKQTVHQLTDAITDKKLKVAKLYKYMQDNTHYISIQLGIGGWQPFDATYVAEKKFGDCKALTNYMYSLLKEAGITSNYTLVNARKGNRFFMSDFPSAYFNHIILSVPLETDTVWLECTSQTLPAGYLSSFTSNRYVLAINENGGALIKTPKYGFKENFQVRKTKAIIDENGNAKISVVTDYKAEQQDELHGKIKRLSKEKVLEFLKEEVDLPQYDILSYDYKESMEKELPVICETLEISAASCAQISGKRLFVEPNLLTKTYRRLTANETRKFSVEISVEYTEIDTVSVSIPTGYVAESTPTPVSISSQFGKYSSQVKIENDKIFYYRSLEIYSGRFPASDYAAFVKFREQIYKADRNKVVMAKANN